MFSGKYNIGMNTPMGMQQGSLMLNQNNDMLSGYIEFMNSRFEIKNGKVSNNKAMFDGMFQTPMGGMNYSVTCTLEGNNLMAIVNTNFGNFNVSGTKIS